MFERILVALKFGPASIHALEKGTEIARQNNAELHIFHALDYLLQDLDADDPQLKRVKDAGSLLGLILWAIFGPL